MIELRGKCGNAKVFTDLIESEAISQITDLLNQKFASDSKVRIMPDVHAGAGCTIGTTMTINGNVCPNLVGVDIGCSMLATLISNDTIGYEKLDSVIAEYIPSGPNVREDCYKADIDLRELRCYEDAKIKDTLAYHSIGTLGGGNHFIEIDTDSSGRYWLVIHTGSRHLGLEVANYYQNAAWEYHKAMKNSGTKATKKAELIQSLKAAGRQADIQSELKKFESTYEELYPDVPKDLAYLEGKLFDDYIHDIKIVQRFSQLNRKAISDLICSHMGFEIVSQFETKHNYIDTDNMILRKGAVSAKLGEQLLIPINMRDGSLLCIGKGNPDWNYSAPHGAGRLYSRSKAKELFGLEEFEKTMHDAGIYSTSVTDSTIDESPMAYKPIDSILENIKDTADVIDILKPVYNYKAH